MGYSRSCKPLNCGFMEPMTGIEPAYSAWEADVLPLNYIGAVAQKASTQRQAHTPDTAP
jgi:hypothetical protein